MTMDTKHNGASIFSNIDTTPLQKLITYTQYVITCRNLEARYIYEICDNLQKFKLLQTFKQNSDFAI